MTVNRNRSSAAAFVMPGHYLGAHTQPIAECHSAACAAACKQLRVGGCRFIYWSAPVPPNAGRRRVRVSWARTRHTHTHTANGGSVSPAQFSTAANLAGKTGGDTQQCLTITRADGRACVPSRRGRRAAAIRLRVWVSWRQKPSVRRRRNACQRLPSGN